MLRKITLLLVIFSVQFSFGQTNYFVGQTGQDAAGFGLSASSPFLTVTYAATQVTAGDTINVLSGTYTNTSYGNGNMWNEDEAVKIYDLHGNASAYITIRPFGNQSVTFKGDGDYIVQIRNSSYIRLQGFGIEGEVNHIPLDSALQYQFIYKDSLGIIHYRVAPHTPDSVVDTMTFPILNHILRPGYFNGIGVLVQNSNHVDISGNHIHHTPGTGLRAFQCDYINFTDNEIDNCSRRSSVGNHGLVIDGSISVDNIDTAKIFILRNRVHHNYNEVYSWNPQKTFINAQIDEGKGITPQRNTVANGWRHGRIRIENNLAYLNGFSGVAVNEGVRVDIINNSCYLNSFTGRGRYLGISIQSGDSISIVNNIVVADTSWQGFALAASDTSNLLISTNLIQGHVDAGIAAIAVNSVFTDPQFNNPSVYDFSLQPSSAAINASLLTMAPLTDFFNNTRDSLPDIGAIEYISPIGIADAGQLLEHVGVYPNPFSIQATFYSDFILKNATLTVYNTYGQIVKQIRNISDQWIVFTRDNLPSGPYFLQLTEKNEIIAIDKIMIAD
ncbi:MAG: T9SS type A sorting domain-containing protein [Bacteroidota bacterium]